MLGQKHVMEATGAQRALRKRRISFNTSTSWKVCKDIGAKSWRRKELVQQEKKEVERVGSGLWTMGTYVRGRLAGHRSMYREFLDLHYEA